MKQYFSGVVGAIRLQWIQKLMRENYSNSREVWLGHKGKNRAVTIGGCRGHKKLFKIRSSRTSLLFLISLDYSNSSQHHF